MLPWLTPAWMAVLITRAAVAQPGTPPRPQQVSVVSPSGGQRLAPSPQPVPGSAVQPGDAWIRRALLAIRSHQSVVASLRQRAQLFGSELFGTGSYLQQGTGRAMQVRLELKIQVAGQTRSMLQIADGRYLWTDWRQRNKRSVDRVDLGRVHDALEAFAHPQGGPADWSLGGLPDLLAGLAADFQFSPPQPSRLGSLPTYRLKGRWRPNTERRAGRAVDSTPPESPTQSADHTPNEVVLQLGRDDLFPYMIEFLRAATGREKPRVNPPASTRPLVRIELFEVRINTAVDTRRFLFRPGDVKLSDRTNAYLSRWQRLATRLGNPPR